MTCYRLIDENTAHHDVSLMARLLGVSRQGYYAWKKRGPSRRRREDAELTEKIKGHHERSNAVTESFFASLETELIDRTVFRTRRDAEQELFSYIGGFYNPWRRHSANGQLSPAEYERRHPPRTSATVAYATA